MVQYVHARMMTLLFDVNYSLLREGWMAEVRDAISVWQCGTGEVGITGEHWESRLS